MSVGIAAVSGSEGSLATAKRSSSSSARSEPAVGSRQPAGQIDRPVGRGLGRTGEPGAAAGKMPCLARLSREDRDRLQGELDAAQLRVGQLERELGELTGYRPADRAGWRPRLATVVERSTGRPGGLLGIDVGASQGVQAGDPVVVAGNQLVGQVASGGAASGWPRRGAGVLKS
jgi:hypothetical protein